MEDKRFYWIKLKTDIFNPDTPIDFLMSQDNGAEYVSLYIMLCLATANNHGRMCNNYGEIIVPYDIEKIQRDTRYFSIDTVRVAMELFKRLGLIYEEADGVLAIAGHDEMVGSEGSSAKRMRDKRERDRLIADVTSVSQCDIEYRDKSIEIRDKSIDIEIEDKPNRKRFVPPTHEEAESYLFEANINVDLNKWFSYYEANGWKVGKNKMKDWKASLRYWASSTKEDKSYQSFTDRWANA